MKVHLNLVLATAVSAAAILGLATASSAQDFDGAYAGIESGVGIVDTDGSTLAGPFSYSDTSAIVGGVLGYRTPVTADSNVVVGLEGDVGFYTNGSNARYGLYGIGGYRVGESGLLYLRVGYDWLDGVNTGAGKGIDGLAFGGGYEFGVTDQLTLRLDYKYIDYGGVSFPDNTIDFAGHEVTAAALFNF